MKKILNRLWRVSAKTWLYLFVITGIVCVLALRHNNQTMVKLRDAVYAADKNNGDVNGALNNLRSYVFAHMNTNVSSGNDGIKPPIQLKYTYQRLYDARQNELQTSNQQVYADAQSYCQSIGQTQFDGTCIQNYVVNHGVKQADITIPPGLYEFDFASPSWSPDLAGWSLVLTVFFGTAFIIKLGASKLFDA